MECWLLVVAIGTFVVAPLALLASTTSLLKRRVPVECGFLLDKAIQPQLNVSTGDSAKPITIRLRNRASTTLTGLIFDARFLDPLVLSGTSSALVLPLGDNVHGRVADGSYYLIRHSGFNLAPEEHLDFRIELNLAGASPGTGHVEVTVYSTQQDYKYRKLDLPVHIT